MSVDISRFIPFFFSFLFLPLRSRGRVDIFRGQKGVFSPLMRRGGGGRTSAMDVVVRTREGRATFSFFFFFIHSPPLKTVKSILAEMEDDAKAGREGAHFYRYRFSPFPFLPFLHETRGRRVGLLKSIIIPPGRGFFFSFLLFPPSSFWQV